MLPAIGRTFSSESPNHFASDEPWVDQADGGVSRVRLAFQARDREAVHAFQKAADPDGNNIEAVFHDPAEGQT